MVAGGDGCTGAVHYVELEIVSIYNDASCNVTVGVGRPGLDVEEENIDQGEADFWGVFDVGGTLYHKAVEAEVGGISWTGQQGFGSGDTIGLLLDCRTGILVVYKNGARLGVPVTGLTGELCWAMTIQGVGVQSHGVRIKGKPPPAGRREDVAITDVAITDSTICP